MKLQCGSVFRVPEQKPGAIATCGYCDWSRFFQNSKRKKGTAHSRARRALLGHVKLAHKDKGLAIWIPDPENMPLWK